MKLKPSISGIVFTLAFALPTFAQNEFIVRPSSTGSIAAIAQRNNLTVIEPIDAQDSVYLVSAPPQLSAQDVDAEVGADPEVTEVEVNQNTSIPEVAQSTGAILDHLPHPSSIEAYGETVLASYAFQPAINLIHLPQAAANFHVAGAGIVAVIDTGIDPNHPVLRNSIVGGYDFVHNIAGSASEFIDLNQQANQALVNSSPNPDTKSLVAMVSQFTAAILDQSTGAILDKQHLPNAFGHGTMVAGIVHRVAPSAGLLPLKAFSGDGTASLSNVLRAIYYAVDHGANVINMSFTLTQPSAALAGAVQYAHDHEVMCVAAAGNTGTASVGNPANLEHVLGVASISNADQRSKFSSYGPGVFVAAPGEGVITTYPGNNYAEATGTSFSAPFVSGTVDLLQQLISGIGYDSASGAIAHAIPISTLLGHGLLDVNRALTSAASSSDGSSSGSSGGDN